jgi:phytoene/squalene synthetase
MRSPEFYQGHLDAVSRSFALCIPQLTAPFREHVALSYLLLRVLDTVEDAPFAEKIHQQRQFSAFRQFLVRPPTAAQLDAFRDSFPASISDAERKLLEDTGAFLEDAYGLPAVVRGVMFSAFDRMASGMATYARRPATRLVDLEDVTRYCCIVAGLVGEMLTRLRMAEGQPAPRMLFAYRFGLFLQKVNILKDQAEDEAADRFFVPDRREILASLREDANGALSYLTSLPQKERGYRIFCAWSLMLGAAALGQMAGPRQSRRAETMELLGRIADIAQDDAALRRRFAALLPNLPYPRAKDPLAKPESADWFVRTLDAPLSERELIDLGAIPSASHQPAAAHQ